MVSTATKRGRPKAVHKTAWGDQIVGLLRRADGRWKVSATGQTFVESDERLAIAKFCQIEAKLKGSELGTVHQYRPVADPSEAAKELVRRARVTGDATMIVAPGGLPTVIDASLRPEQWAWLRTQFLTRKEWVSQQVGLRQLAWFDEKKEPGESPKLAELIDLYADKAGLSSNEASRSKHFWREFKRAVGIERIGDLTHEHVGAYEKAVIGSGYAPKSILHRYRKIRCVLAYAIKRGRGIEDCRRALDTTAMLEIKNHTPLDPRPISPQQFWAIYSAATDAGDKTFATLMLTALNCAMYGGEVSALRWDEVDLKSGELVTRRPKTGVSRVAILWPETLAALRKIERCGDAIFYSARRSYYANAVVKTWRRYCDVAEVSNDVVFSQLRDAAFSTACGVSVDQAKLLAGHRLSGATDHYIRRNPSLVADACKAVRSAFYAPAKRKSGRAA